MHIFFLAFSGKTQFFQIKLDSTWKSKSHRVLDSKMLDFWGTCLSILEFWVLIAHLNWYPQILKFEICTICNWNVLIGTPTFKFPMRPLANAWVVLKIPLISQYTANVFVTNYTTFRSNPFPGTFRTYYIW